MKTKIILLLTGLFLFTPKIILAASLYLSIPDGSPGSTVTASVGFKDATGVDSFELVLDFSFGAILSTNLSLFTRKTDFFTSRSLSGQESNIVEKGKTGKRIYLAGIQPNSKTGTAEIGTITFNVSSSANIGDTQKVKFSGQIRTESGDAFLVPVSKTFTASGCMKGDVNTDDDVTPEDAVAAFYLSLKDSWTSDELCRADFDGDEDITPKDAVAIFWESFN
ncbi:MAG: hypothetical protein GY749_13915 [Desulfobacteraceae bacterium]|nr:hypothetical protein [Desulfobacteraceae bacterium]